MRAGLTGSTKCRGPGARLYVGDMVTTKTPKRKGAAGTPPASKSGNSRKGGKSFLRVPRGCFWAVDYQGNPVWYCDLE